MMVLLYSGYCSVWNGQVGSHTNAYNSKGSWGSVGYDNRHASIEGFGHFHEFQVGGVVFMPTTVELKTVSGSLENPDEGYRSRFDKDSEHAETGFFFYQRCRERSIPEF